MIAFTNLTVHRRATFQQIAFCGIDQLSANPYLRAIGTWSHEHIHLIEPDVEVNGQYKKMFY
jgi:hypothetical protein